MRVPQAYRSDPTDLMRNNFPDGFVSINAVLVSGVGYSTCNELRILVISSCTRASSRLLRRPHRIWFNQLFRDRRRLKLYENPGTAYFIWHHLRAITTPLLTHARLFTTFPPSPWIMHTLVMIALCHSPCWPRYF